MSSLVCSVIATKTQWLHNIHILSWFILTFMPLIQYENKNDCVIKFSFSKRLSAGVTFSRSYSIKRLETEATYILIWNLLPCHWVIEKNKINEKFSKHNNNDTAMAPKILSLLLLIELIRTLKSRTINLVCNF